MAIIRRNGGELFPTLSRFWNDDFFTRDMMNWGLSNFSTTGTSIPAVNIRETKNSFEVELAAPGMKKNDFKIELDSNTLTISAEKTEEKESKSNEERFVSREYSYQSFQRSFNLPKDVVDVDRIEAHYEDGVLQLTIPKQETAKTKQAKKIKVV